MTTIFLTIFFVCLAASTAWWILSDFLDKRQAYWYEAWRKCDGERGFLKLKIRNLENTYWKGEADRIEAERQRLESDKHQLENEYNALIVELQKLKES